MDKLTQGELDKIKSIIVDAEKKDNVLSFNKKVVTLVLGLNITFTIIVLILYYIGWNEPSTLIDNWFKFTGTELIALAGIKGIDTIKEMVEIWKGGNQ